MIQRMLLGVSCVAFLASCAKGGQVAEREKPEHIVLTSSDIKWGAGPASLPPGAKAALLEGNPKEGGFFCLRLKIPAGYKIPPHFHPVKERVAVISGKALLGFGDTFNKSGMREMDAGSYVSLTPNSSHYVLAVEETVLQLASIGPWKLTYVNPADDPRSKSGD